MINVRAIVDEVRVGHGGDEMPSIIVKTADSGHIELLLTAQTIDAFKQALASVAKETDAPGAQGNADSSYYFREAILSRKATEEERAAAGTLVDAAITWWIKPFQTQRQRSGPVRRLEEACEAMHELWRRRAGGDR